ncbi:MAG: Hpt domain-containing protein, partial [Cyanobacteria bacterium J06607_10]
MLPEQQQRIMGYFIEEAKDHLNTIEQGLLSLQATIADSEKANEIFRAAHSVKGGAAMLGLESIQKTAHRMEDYFKVLKESPVQVDSTLETMFLRISDGLKDLLEQLEGPFGLTPEKAQEIMAGVDPVFGQLETHLDKLVGQSGTGKGATAPGSAKSDALQISFKQDVADLLRQMLAAFKQTDNEESRKALYNVCTQLTAIGERFELSAWCDLTETARLASGNPANEYRTLAPILIKDIKKSQELVLAGRASEVSVSDTLQALLPEDILAVDTDETPAETDDLFDDDLFGNIEPEEDLDGLFGSEPIQEASGSPDLGDASSSADSSETGPTSEEPPIDRLSVDLDFDEIPSELSALNRDADSDAKADESLDALLATVNVTGPDVGTEELNSLADLFDGDLDELDNTLGAHPFVSEEMRLHPEKIDLAEEDDLTDLLGSDISEELNQTSAANSDEIEDDLFGGTLTDGGFATADDLDLDAIDEPIEAPNEPATTFSEMDSLTEDVWGTDTDINGNDSDGLFGADLGGLFEEAPAADRVGDQGGEFTEPVSTASADPVDLDLSDLEALDLEVPEMPPSELDDLDLEGPFQPFEQDETGTEGSSLGDIDLEQKSFSQTSEDISAEVEEKRRAAAEAYQYAEAPAVSLFSDEHISPSEEEIEFPTLTGVKLAEAEKDIDSFFLDTDAGQENSDFELPDLAEPSATEVADDPWGELLPEGSQEELGSELENSAPENLEPESANLEEQNDEALLDLSLSEVKQSTQDFTHDNDDVDFGEISEEADLLDNHDESQYASDELPQDLNSAIDEVKDTKNIDTDLVDLFGDTEATDSIDADQGSDELWDDLMTPSEEGDLPSSSDDEFSFEAEIEEGNKAEAAAEDQADFSDELFEERLPEERLPEEGLPEGNKRIAQDEPIQNETDLPANDTGELDSASDDQERPDSPLSEKAIPSDDFSDFSLELADGEETSADESVSNDFSLDDFLEDELLEDGVASSAENVTSNVADEDDLSGDDLFD